MCYIVVDLEMCRIPKRLRTKSFKWASETIQIGAVMLDDNYEVIDKFNTFVKPELGVISTEITMLTGIRNDMVFGAPSVREALMSFANWIPEDATLVAWSDSDELQIRHEVEGKELSFEGIEKFNGEWIDCQALFSEVMNNPRRYNLEEALNLSDIDYDIHLHDGLIDASNTALLFKKIKTEKNFKLNDYYLASKQEPERLTCSLGDLFSCLKFA